MENAIEKQKEYLDEKMDKLKDYVDEQMVSAPPGGTRESAPILKKSKDENLNSEYNATRSSRLSEKS